MWHYYADFLEFDSSHILHRMCGVCQNFCTFETEFFSHIFVNRSHAAVNFCSHLMFVCVVYVYNAGYVIPNMSL
jgi:hypothetical protein